MINGILYDEKFPRRLSPKKCLVERRDVRLVFFSFLFTCFLFVAVLKALFSVYSFRPVSLVDYGGHCDEKKMSMTALSLLAAGDRGSQ
jgi:hypothetical protein